MRSVKLTLACLLAVAALILAALQIQRLAQGQPAMQVVGAAAGIGLAVLISFLLFWSALIGAWEPPPRQRDAPTSWLDSLRRPIDPESRFAKRLVQARSVEGRLPGDMAVVFHTYWGVLVFVVQTEWRFALPEDEARAILWEMHRSNFMWGNLAFGALIIPLLSLIEYWQQIRSIRNQSAGLA
jgi:hypothetical protein